MRWYDDQQSDYSGYDDGYDDGYADASDSHYVGVGISPARREKIAEERAQREKQRTRAERAQREKQRTRANRGCILAILAFVFGCGGIASVMQKLGVLPP